MNQLPLELPPPRARRRDPATSHAAAARVAKVTPNQRDVILAKLTRPMTAYELAAATGFTQVQVCRRLPELNALRLAHPTDQVRDGSRLWDSGPRPTPQEET